MRHMPLARLTSPVLGVVGLVVGACARSGTSAAGADPAGATHAASANAGGGAHAASTTVPVPGGCSVRRTTPADAVGCYVAAIDTIGAVADSPLFWHLDTYPTRAAAASGRGGRGTIAEAHGRVWLFTIADSEWRPAGGERVARVGPLLLTPGRAYVAHFIEGVVPPGARTPSHRHAGPEAWYVLEGTNCLQTPEEVRVARAGESLIVPEGPPMVLTGVGQTTRRSLAVVVHDASQPWTIVMPSFTPKASCPG